MKNARQAPPTIVDSAFSSEKAPLTAIDSTFSSEEALSTPIIIHKNRITMIMLKEKIGYGLGDMASSMFWKLFGSYLMIFYTDVFGMPAAAVGTMFLVTRVWDSAFDPVVGILADRTHSRRGKFRPYLLFLAVPFALIGILTFTTPQWSLTAKIIYAYATYSLMMMVYSAINVPYASLLGVISADPHDRNLLAVYRMLFAYLGSFIALLLFMPMVNVFSRGHSEQYGWMMAVVVIAVACAALFYGCFALTRERVKPIKEVQNPLKEDLKDLFHNRPWWILLGAGIAALVFNSIRDGATVYYFKYFIVEENHETVSLFGLSFVLSGLYLAVRQYHRRDACRPGEQPHRKEKDLHVVHDMRHAAQHRVLLARPRRHRTDIHLPGADQHLCGQHFPVALEHVCRLCGLLGTEDRQPRHGAYLFVLVHEPEVRLGHRKRRYGLAACLFRFPGQCRAKRAGHSRH